MKTLKFLTFLGLSLFVIACGGNADTAQDEAATDQTEVNNEAEADADEQGPEYTSAYICPMHCDGSGSDKPGECPVCGMDYVKNEDMPANGHDHHHEDGHDHDGHNH